MRKYYSLVLTLSLSLLIGCEIVQETKFERNGSGQYSLGIDMSGMMKMGLNQKFSKKQMDTVINFSEFLDKNKDSISKLSKQDRVKLEQLQNFYCTIKIDSLSNAFNFKINYNFDNIKDLQLFGEKLKNQNVKELDLLNTQTKDSKGIEDFFTLNKGYITKFNKSKFSTKISSQTIKETKKHRDSTITKDNFFANLILFKTRYIFPYRIKNTNNENIKILSDFKSIEISGNAYDLNYNPTYFDLEIEFEK